MIDRIDEQIDALSIRGRVLIFSAAVLFLFIVLDGLLFGPVIAKQKMLYSSIQQQNQSVAQVQTQLGKFAAGSGQGLDAESHIVVARRVEEQKAMLGELQTRLIPADKIVYLLEDTLAEHTSLKLISLRTLQADRQHRAEGSSEVVLFEHHVEVLLQGGYADLMRYLDDLESSSMQVFWKSVVLNVVQYPRSELRLVLYTLSKDATWLQF